MPSKFCSLHSTNCCLPAISHLHFFSSYFPKQEIFDEVREEQLLPSWSYELRTVLDTLAVLLAQGAEVGVLEEKITEVRMEDVVVVPFVNPRG